MMNRPGTHAPGAQAERHDHDGHPAHYRCSDLDAWIWELAEAAPPLTPEQRHTLALLLNTPGLVPARPGGALGPDQTP